MTKKHSEGAVRKKTRMTACDNYNSCALTVDTSVVGEALAFADDESAARVARALPVAAERRAARHVLPAVQRVREHTRAAIPTIRCGQNASEGTLIENVLLCTRIANQLSSTAKLRCLPEALMNSRRSWFKSADGLLAII